MSDIQGQPHIKTQFIFCETIESYTLSIGIIELSQKRINSNNQEVPIQKIY